MKILLLIAVLFSAHGSFAQAAPESLEDLRRVVCYARDSQWHEYQASGFRRDLQRVKRQVIRVCEQYSERPSTCRLTRCRP